MQGTPERLLTQLIEDNTNDITYVEDFLLAYRTFIDDSKTIADKLLVWFDEEKYRAKVSAPVCTILDCFFSFIYYLKYFYFMYKFLLYLYM